MKSKEAVKEEIIQYLRQIYDPEIPVNIYDLGLIYNISLDEIEEGYFCMIQMTLTSPACPVAENLVEQVYNVIYIVEEIQKVGVDLVFEPPWDPKTMISYEVQLELGLL